MLTCSLCLALFLTSLPFVPGSLHRWPRTIYLQDAHPSPTPRRHCQHPASMSPSSRWLKRKQLFGKGCLLSSSISHHCAPQQLTTAEHLPKMSCVGTVQLGHHYHAHLSFCFTVLKPGQSRRHFCVCKQGIKLNTVSFLA